LPVHSLSPFLDITFNNSLSPEEHAVMPDFDPQNVLVDWKEQRGFTIAGVVSCAPEFPARAPALRC